VDSIGIIGLVAGLWFALSPVGDERRHPSAWLGWLLAGTATVLLLAGTLTEPLTPQFDGTVTADWTTEPTPYSTEQGDSSGSGGSPFRAPTASATSCTLACG
jgi:hypothetical protein